MGRPVGLFRFLRVARFSNFPLAPRILIKRRAKTIEKANCPRFEKMDGLAKAYQGASERSSVCCMISVTCICHFQRRILDVSEQAHWSSASCLLAPCLFHLLLRCSLNRCGILCRRQSKAGKGPSRQCSTRGGHSILFYRWLRPCRTDDPEAPALGKQA